MRKREKAVALRYDAEKDTSPKVVAKGQGHVAQKIKETAKKKRNSYTPGR
jgi:flagellar biosynthesis protein